ncbi:MAG TPA: hypothetical protein VF933_31375 [Streptosporangiaceae bacterium]
MDVTPASELARVCQRFPQWTIRPAEPGPGFTAYRRGRGGQLQAVYAPDLPSLELRLAEKGSLRP